jgi:ribosomal protein L19
MLTIRLLNTSTEPLSTIIVDYPSATFGKDKLAPGDTFASPVKITESGPLRIQFTDSHAAVHTYTGLVLHPNQEGLIEVRLTQTSASVELH